MRRMDRKMMQGMDPNPSRSFAKQMMAHHQGAIAMSHTALKYAKDPEIRRIARKTIRENARGIKKLRSWLGRHGG